MPLAVSIMEITTYAIYRYVLNTYHNIERGLPGEEPRPRMRKRQVREIPKRVSRIFAHDFSREKKKRVFTEK